MLSARIGCAVPSAGVALAGHGDVWERLSGSGVLETEDGWLSTPVVGADKAAEWGSADGPAPIPIPAGVGTGDGGGDEMRARLRDSRGVADCCMEDATAEPLDASDPALAPAPPLLTKWGAMGIDMELGTCADSAVAGVAGAKYADGM
mmetsp:Transcript_20455/g.57620  ORF Transcript_20455/g.57620 Transcript_20455/m.57620 type:complete len:148 (-) Transcript_20455:758-1201(-)